jgi:hypothetical protein
MLDLFGNAQKIQTDDRPPSAKLSDLLHGRISWDEADPAIQSWARYFIYEAACDILDKPDRAARRLALAKIPDHIRPRIEAEVIRLYPSV